MFNSTKIKTSNYSRIIALFNLVTTEIRTKNECHRYKRNDQNKSFKMSQPNVENDVDAFKVSFKIYKRRDRPVDLSKVVDFRYPEKWKDQIVEIKAVDLAEGEEQVSELKSVSEWRIFEFLPNAKNSAGAGIIFIPNPFTDSGKVLLLLL